MHFLAGVFPAFTDEADFEIVFVIAFLILFWLP